MTSFSFINAESGITTYVFVALLVILIVALLVVPMFTNKKRAQQTAELHRSLKPGDLIKTIGGIIGTIIEVRQISPVDKEMIIETGVGDNKSTMVFDIQALYQVISRSATATVAETNNSVEDKEVSLLSDNNQPDVKTDVNDVAEQKIDEQAVKDGEQTVESEDAVSPDSHSGVVKRTSSKAKKPANK